MEDDQQFCLRWNNHQNTLISNFDKLLENGTLVDCTLAAEGQFLKAHKVVLSACSPYFANLLKEQYDKHPIFILKDVKYQELRAMMDYMYRGEVNISQDQLAALLKAAESLQIKGLSDRPQRSTDQHPNINVPGRMQHPHGGGYTLEQTKRPRLGPVIDTPDMREGSSSPTSRKRKKLRRRSIENVMDNHEHSNSSAHSTQPINTSTPSITSGTAAIVATSQQQQQQSQQSLQQSSVSQQQQQQGSIVGTKKTENVSNIKQTAGSSDDVLLAEQDNQMEQEKQIKKDQNKQQRKSGHDKDELLIEPKNEYEEVNEPIEDLTEDPEELMDEEDLDNQAGPSHHGGEGSSQGFPQWPADRSQDEFIMTAQDQGQQRDPQVKHDKSEQTDITTDEFELDDCLLESNDIVITQNKDGFVLHVKKLGNVTSSKLATTDEEHQDQQQQHQPQHIQHQQQQQHHQSHHQPHHQQDQSHSHQQQQQHVHHHHHQQQQQQQQHHHHQQLHHHLQLATPTNVVAVPGVHQLTADDNQGKTLTSLHPIKLPSAECELINLKKIQPTTSAIATAAIIPPQHLQEHHTNIVTTNPQTLNTILGIREVNIQQKNLGSRIKYRGKYSTSPVHDTDGTVQLLATISPKQEIGPTTTTVMAGEKKFEIAEITDLNTPQASIISDLVKYAEIDDIELPDGTKIGIGYAPTEISEHHIQTAQTVQQVQQVTDSPSHEIIQHDRNGAPGQETTITKSYTILTTTPIKQTQQSQQHQQHQVTTQHQIQQHHQAQQQIQIQQQPQQQQQQHTTTTTTTTYELSLSDSSLTQSEDNEKLYVCRHCGKKYRWKSTLRRHENVECGGKEPCHPCPYCTYKAKQRGNLGVHVRKHHPEKPQLESIRGRKSV